MKTNLPRLRCLTNPQTSVDANPRGPQGTILKVQTNLKSIKKYNFCKIFKRCYDM